MWGGAGRCGELALEQHLGRAMRVLHRVLHRRGAEGGPQAVGSAAAAGRRRSAVAALRGLLVPWASAGRWGEASPSARRRGSGGGRRGRGGRGAAGGEGAGGRPVPARVVAASAATSDTLGHSRTLSGALSATMKCVFFSRARYTLPNLPLPSGLPISKSCSDHFRRSSPSAPASAFADAPPDTSICASLFVTSPSSGMAPVNPRAVRACETGRARTRERGRRARARRGAGGVARRADAHRLFELPTSMSSADSEYH